MSNKRAIALAIMFLLIVGIFAFIGYVQIKNSQNNEITLTVSALNKSQDWSYTFENQTVLQILQKNNTVQLSNSSYGTFVECINDICSNTQYFWTYYINGGQIQDSPSDYYANKGDSIEFRYEKI